MKKTNFLVLMVLACTTILNAQLSVDWSFKAEKAFKSTAVVKGIDGNLYLGCTDGKLYAFNPTSKDTVWTFNAEGSIESDPIVAANGVIYVASKGNKLFAINSDGTEKWSFDLENMNYFASPVLSSDESKLYVAANHSGRMYCFDIAAQDTIWSLNVSGKFKVRTPALSANDSVIYFGAEDDKLYALNVFNKTVEWSFAAADNVQGGVSVATDGTIYCGSDDNNFYAINSDGTKKWEYATGGSVDAASLLDSNGDIYVGSKDGKVYKFNASGDTVWTCTTGSFIWCKGVLNDDESMFYIGSGDQRMYGINSVTGDTVWTYKTEADIFCTPYVDANGIVYFGSIDKTFYALDYTVASGVVNIADKTLQVYPNPATFEITISGLEENSEITILTLSGGIVKQGIYNGSAFNVSDVQSGMYLLKADKIVKKLIIE